MIAQKDAQVAFASVAIYDNYRVAWEAAYFGRVELDFVERAFIDSLRIRSYKRF